MKNVEIMSFKKISDDRGVLIPMEYPLQLPFEIKRIYYIYDVEKKERRGFHSHRDLEQILIAISGSVKILVKTPNEEQIIELNDKSKGLYIGPMIWREMFDFSEDAVLLVLASREYNKKDYIRNLDDYLKEAREIEWEEI